MQPVQRHSKASKAKHDVTHGHENEAQSPWKNLTGGGEFAVFTKNRDFSRLRNKIRMRPLVPRERNNDAHDDDDDDDDDDNFNTVLLIGDTVNKKKNN